ncbi:armadillo-type protein [Phellopilus nigrolimitatus]|nr:armadillo-type protein [Phellopilus nigrolimitatus]
MDYTVKAAMLRSSQTIKAAPVPASVTPKKTSGTLRKSKSSDSVTSPRPSHEHLASDFPKPQTASRFLGAAMRSSISLARLSSDDESSAPRTAARHSRGISLDMPRSSSKGHLGLGAKSESTGAKAESKWAKDMSPSRYANILTSTSSVELDIEAVKKLRLLLRNESASWTESFLQLGGYSAVLTRLNELLEVEWREEQHDDQLLHELLRCFKALSTSEIGCAALRSACPAPFAQLVRLLFSDKKPGDVATRQLIAELLLIIFDLYPPSALPSVSSSSPIRQRRREVWDECSDDEQYPANVNHKLISLPPPHRSLFSFLRTLLLTKAPPPAEIPATPVSPHEFIESLHIPRIYKTYLQELSDVCRDYFWVFCHPSNTIWVLDETDEKRVERPRAPGGMTGGVEFEAMGYLTTHFRLLNGIAKSTADLNLPKDNELSAHRFHSDLFASGIERIILVARKASTTYYPTLHLEIARYVSLAAQARFELPWTLSRTIGAPPAGMAKSSRIAKDRERNRNSASTMSSRGQRSSPATPSRDRVGAVGVPKIPTPKKIEPIRF